MSEKLLTDMSYEEFITVIDNFVDRSSRETAEMSASTFFELLFENAKQRVQETIPLTGRIVNGELEFILPSDREATIQTRHNQIVVGDKLLVVSLENGNQPELMTNGSAGGSREVYVPRGASYPAPVNLVREA